jgi:hypothetical protein
MRFCVGGTGPAADPDRNDQRDATPGRTPTRLAIMPDLRKSPPAGVSFRPDNPAIPGALGLRRHGSRQGGTMCRNIKTLANFEPPATEDEIRASALQFVRKLSGATHPSQANRAAFDRAVDEVTDAARRLIASLESRAEPRNREEEARKARERSRRRFGQAEV